ncbi:hypothetical protein GGR55DRAFT_703350 [Xylaria sp. FL0064]|nr:hypothetical protein GGR55DRAFT_703350 [Xylaria sp. FL0064]
MPSRPLLFELRPSEGRNLDKRSDNFYLLLTATKTHKATCPEDKIFALESLLPLCIGNLIFPDYGESGEVILRRTTARCYNASKSLNAMIPFDLRFESTNATISILSGPSWVLDFSFSDGSIHNNEKTYKVTDTVTLNGFIYHNAFSRLLKLVDTKSFRLLFATPKKLFCTGISIDRIHQTGTIPCLVEETEGMVMMGFMNWIREQSQKRLHAGGLPRSLDAAGPGDSSRMPFDIVWFFLMNLDKKIPRGDIPIFFRKRFKELSGKTYFITERGLVGIATSPVQEGDLLTLLHDAPVYIILREANEQMGERPAEIQEHRIVARAAVDDRGVDMPALISSLPRRSFQII